jgi:hypothetical protein
MHVPFAFWLVDVLRPATIVELGTHNGVSYSAMCQTVKSLKLASRCFAIDTWKGDEHAGFYPEHVYEDFRSFHDQHYSAFSRLVRSTFDEALPYFEDESIDLLHIDGLHTYEAVRHDFEAWLPKLSRDAVVVFHDTNVRERNFGVFRLWNELARDRPHFVFLDGHGLGVLGLGRNYPTALQYLFSLNEENPLVSAVREIFSSLGWSLIQKYEQSAATQALAQREAKVAALEEALIQRDAKIAAVEAALVQRDAEITSLRQQVARTEERARRLEVKVSDAESALAKAKQVLTVTKATLKEQLTQTEARLNERFGEIATLTRFLREKEDAAKQAADRAEWMRQTSAVLFGGGSWRGKLVWFLPGPLAYALRKIQLKRRGLFDAKAYLREHPDVARSGADPLRHYLNHGLKEDRRRG